MRKISPGNAHDVNVTNVVIPAIAESYNSLNEYIALMSISARDSWDKGRSWGDAIAMQWLAKALKLNIVVWGEDSSHDPPITQSYDYSSGISNRTIDIAHVTLEGFISHYEPVIRVHNVAFDVKSQHYDLSNIMQNPCTESRLNLTLLCHTSRMFRKPVTQNNLEKKSLERTF